MNIEHISVSRKQCWDQCHCQYRFKYHEKIKPTGPEPFYFIYGKVVHKIAEEFVSRRGQSKIEAVAQEVLSGQIPVEEGEEGPIYAPRLLPDYQRKFPGHLQSIKNLTEQIGTDGTLEMEFKYDLDPPNGKHVKGFIDRLIQRGDKWFIIDYKTTKRGSWRKTPTTIMHDLQLRCYARVVQRTFNVPAENIKAALYYLEGGNLIATRFNEHSLITAEKELLSAYNQIYTTPPEKAYGKVGDHCQRCDYKDICQYYSIGKQWHP